MASRKREKELARAKYERQQARRSARRGSQRRLQIGIGVAVAVVIVAAIVGVSLANRDTGLEATPDQSASPSSSASSTPNSTPSSTPSASPSSTASSTSAPGVCASPGTPRADDKTYPPAPAVPAALPTTMTLHTNCGDVVIALDPKAPKTVASEAFLAEQGFYTNTSCHRLTTNIIYVLQCGDPKGNGSGGPGYKVPDENLPTGANNNYPAGTVAMANAGPGTSGSQFFLVYRDTTLSPDYTIWGHVTSGLDILQKVAAAGTKNPNGDGPPTQPLFIQSAAVSN